MSNPYATCHVHGDEHPAEDVLLVNGEEVKVNKHHLAYNSTYFERFFFAKEYRENKEIIVEHPANVDDFRRMLDTLCPKNVPLDDQCIEAVLHLADQYFMHDVTRKCQNFLAEKSKHMAMFKYRLADKYGLETLKQQILDSEEFCKYYNLLETLEEYAKLDELARTSMVNSLKQKMAYAELIGVPNVANLEGNYNSEKLLKLMQNGNGITKSIYIQRNQHLVDEGLLQAIVDLLASAEKPDKLVGEVKIECCRIAAFKWPQNGKFALKEKKMGVAYTFNEASGNPSTHHSNDAILAEYELANRECHFQVLLYYAAEEYFNEWVFKFVYRRLDDLALEDG